MDRAEADSIDLMESNVEKLMPWFQIALAWGFAAVVTAGFPIIRSLRRQQVRTRRSQNQRAEEVHIAREWEDLQRRLNDRSMETELTAVDN
jgi:hypothetical protein